MATATIFPPRALRVLLLPDRLVLHDVTYALRGGRGYTDRNALVDVVNMVHTKAQHLRKAPVTRQDRLIDVSPAPPPASRQTEGPPTPSTPDKHRYLVFPFTGAPAYEAFGPQDAGVLRDDDVLSVEAAAGFLGILRLHSGNYCVLASNIKHAGVLPSGPVLAVTKVKLIRLVGGVMSKEDREFAQPIAKVLESGNVYFSSHVDLTRHQQKIASGIGGDNSHPNSFWWTFPLAMNAGDVATKWALRTTYGFIGSHLMRFGNESVSGGSGEFYYTIISRRSRRRAGTRYITRGVDGLGDVANFVETEQVVWAVSRPYMYTSFIIIRGSVPVFWRQNNGIARPSPELDSDITASRKAFKKHFDNVTRSYGEIAVVSLVDKMGSEGVLADAFERHFELDLRGEPAKLVAFDFHRHCAGKEYERGLAALLSRIRDDIRRYSFFSMGMDKFGHVERQKGVFRVNCVDCLDRTNVVQSIIGRVALTKQLAALFTPDARAELKESGFRLYSDSEDRFKHVWGDNADAVSKQYSGTGALKTDFTRTGKRSTTGVIGDGVKSVMRMYYKNFVDEGRQESIDLLCGSASIQPLHITAGSPTVIQPKQTSGDLLLDGLDSISKPKPKPKPAAVWYKFQAQRVNAGGDRQDIVIELGDSHMYLSTPDGVRVEYPRNTLQAWERIEDGRPTDRRFGVRLRLIFEPSEYSPVTASPLDLMFKGGTIARETFLRAVLMWATPKVMDLMGRKPIRLRCIAGVNIGDHQLSEWDLSIGGRRERDIIAIVIPETFSSTRAAGLSAVPQDIDNSSYVLISAAAVPNGGPAIAVLASKDLSSAVMAVSQAVYNPSSGGTGVAVSMMVAGTTVCFASVNVNGPEDLFRVLSSLKLRNSAFDITNQFHHVCIAGAMGDLKWKKEEMSDASRRWVNLNDGSSVYSLDNGLSVMRNSFPGIKWIDHVNDNSYWVETPTSSGKPQSVCILSDGTTEGRPPPCVPKNMTQFVATLTNLNGKDIKTPPNVDPNTPIITFLNIYSNYSSADAYGTRPNPRPTPNPSWPEQIRIVFLPADKDDIMASFLMGQILIATPLSDTIVAGHFVIPVSVAGDTGAEFSVPVRLAGITTGRINGFLHVMPLNEGLDESRRATSNLETKFTNLQGSNSERKSTPSSSSQALTRPPAVERSAIQQQQQLQQPAFTSGPRSSSFMPSELSNRMAAVDVDAVRKKGSRQLKSVMGKLSSFMAPTSSSGGSGATQRPRVVEDEDWVRPPASASMEFGQPTMARSRPASTNSVPKHFDSGNLSTRERDRDRDSTFDFFK